MQILKDRETLSFTERLEEFISIEKKKIKLVLLLVIFLLVILSVAEHLNLRNKLEQASKYEMILVLVAKEKISLGKKLDKSLVEFIPYSFKKANRIMENSGDVLITENNYRDIKNKLENFVVNKTIYSGDLIRKDLFINDSEPLISELIPENHSIIDLELDYKGSKKYFKEGDFVKLYKKSKKSSSLKFSKEGQIIILNKPLRADSKKLEISLAVPNSIFKEVLSAHNSKELEIVIEKKTKNSTSTFTKTNFQRLSINNSKGIKVF